jgi:secreted Zn-dependent insulinase-like peptidase
MPRARSAAAYRGWSPLQLMKATSSELHPFHKFGTGNLKTLRDDPAR